MAISNEDLFSLIRLYMVLNDEHRETIRQTSGEPFKTLYEGVERFMEARREEHDQKQLAENPFTPVTF